MSNVLLRGEGSQKGYPAPSRRGDIPPRYLTIVADLAEDVSLAKLLILSLLNQQDGPV
jgi:hypothetical protein